MPSHAITSDVVIIGAGPVGLGLAIDLALRDVSVCLVERHRQPQKIPKGQNLTQRTGEHFHAWGVSEAIRAASPIPASYGNEGLTAYRSLFSGYHYDWFKRASVRQYYAADNERLPQYETERVLRDRAKALSNISFETGWTYDTHTTDAESVCVTIHETDGHDEKTLCSQFLVGCDGARSRVRDTQGLTQSIDARDRRMALLVFQSKSLNDLLEASFPGKTIFNALHPDLEGYWQFLGRVDLNHTWFFHAPVPDDATRENFDFTALLQNAIGASFSVDFSYIGFWDLRFTQADAYHDGRVFVAGDAAHSHPPYGGYGVNVGFEDARNLSWKLAGHIHGWGNQELLSTYTTERHPVFASTRDHFIASMIHDDAQFTSEYDPAINKTEFENAWHARATGGQAQVQLYVPNYAGSPIVWGAAGARSGALGEHHHDAKAGFHLTPQSLDNERAVFDELGPNFTLIAIQQPDAVIRAFKDAAHSLRIPLTTIETTATTETDRWAANLILVRPDQFVAFAGDTLTQRADDILNRAIAG